MYRKFYSYHDMPHPVRTEQPSLPSPAAEPKNSKTPETDDLILGAVMLLLLLDDCNDKLLLLAIAYLFLSGHSG